MFAKVELLSRCLLSSKAQSSLPCKQRMFVYCWVYFAGGHGKDESKRRDTYKTAMTHCVDIICWSSCLADEWNKLGPYILFCGGFTEGDHSTCTSQKASPRTVLHYFTSSRIHQLLTKGQSNASIDVFACNTTVIPY